MTLQDEINHVRLYLELQKQRFRDQLEIIWDVDPESLTTPVPKMILQPIVENYFKHGMNTHAGVGRISISTRIAENGRLIVVIENNGLPSRRRSSPRSAANLRRPFITLTETMPAKILSGC